MQFLKRLICKIFGHDYPSPCFFGNALHFCRRCGEEILGRTFSDLRDMEPMSAEELEETLIDSHDF